jgi:hypothetical protein
MLTFAKNARSHLKLKSFRRSGTNRSNKFKNGSSRSYFISGQELKTALSIGTTTITAVGFGVGFGLGYLVGTFDSESWEDSYLKIFGSDDKSVAVQKTEDSRALEKLDHNVLARKLMSVKTGKDVFFNLKEAAWIVENDPDSAKLIKSCEVFMRVGAKYTDVSAVMKKLVNLTTVKTDKNGANLIYPVSLRHFTMEVTGDEEVFITDLPFDRCDIPLETLELIHDGRTTCKPKVKLHRDQIPSTIKILRVIGPIANLGEYYDSYIWSKNFNLYGHHFPDLEVFDVKDQEVEIWSGFNKKIKYLRCANLIKKTEKFPDAIDLKHLEVMNIDSQVFYDIIAAADLTTLKVYNGVCSNESIRMLPKNLQSFAAQSVPVDMISVIPDTCTELAIEELTGSQVENLTWVKWPANLKSLTLGNSKLNPELYKSLPSTVERLYLSNDKMITDVHLATGNTIPQQLKLLVLTNNTNVTSVGLGPLIQKGCFVVANIDENEKTFTATKQKLKSNYKLFLEEKL